MTERSRSVMTSRRTIGNTNSEVPKSQELARFAISAQVFKGKSAVKKVLSAIFPEREQKSAPQCTPFQKRTKRALYRALLLTLDRIIRTRVLPGVLQRTTDGRKTPAVKPTLARSHLMECSPEPSTAAAAAAAARRALRGALVVL